MTPNSLPQAALDHVPGEVCCAADYEMLARQFVAAPSLAYIAGGSGAERTLQANAAAFRALGITPRLLRDVSAGHTRLRLLGREWLHPILLAPVAYQKLAHPLGETETARAAEATDSCMVASTLASCSLEEIAAHAGREKWFQLYFQAERAVTLDLLRRAEAAGYTALVLTLDASVQSPSQRALRAGFRLPDDVRTANLQGYPAAPQRALGPQQSRIFQGAMAAAPTWRDLEWLLEQTCLPVLVKGVLHADDARALRGAGIAGLVVSNHGGRALDGAPASLRALPTVRAAVGEGYPVLLDGGIRAGTDIFKALALGADAVMVGRLQVYALGVAGALGVAHMLRLLREELELCMAQAGCATLADIAPAMVAHHFAGGTQC